MNDLGESYIPADGVDQLSPMAVTDAYQVFSNGLSETFQLAGESIDPSTTGVPVGGGPVEPGSVLQRLL